MKVELAYLICRQLVRDACWRGSALHPVMRVGCVWHLDTVTAERSNQWLPPASGLVAWITVYAHLSNVIWVRVGKQGGCHKQL
jgi:hypothetical protein